MTIGEKIIKLRQKNGISQENLAFELDVSRQAVSRWEMNQSIPQVEKIIEICNFFNISTDELLTNQSISIIDKKQKNKYFGTDGFRGKANINLTSMHAYKIGRFLGWYYSKQKPTNHRPKIVIGKDTRRSSYMIEYSLVAGITASGADAYMLHVTTTPSVSYVTRQDEFDCGVMITASHNPYFDNGIKLMNSFGEKIDNETISLIEAYLDGDFRALNITGEDLPFATEEKLGLIVDYSSGRNRYIAYLIALASRSFKNLKIALDCANGASWMIAKSVFSALGAQIDVIGANPNGLNINDNCGSTNVNKLCKLVKEKHYDLGFAFDGDADRCIAVDNNGHVVDGDMMLYVLANRLKEREMLNKNTIVTTIMSNSGFIESLKTSGINCEQTQVGDRFVYELMQDKDYSLGGEQSGHIIIKKYATTGDGILTAIMITEEVLESKTTLSALTAPVKLFPQYLLNVKVKDKTSVLNDESVILATSIVENKINKRGRVLLRESGTEPIIRIMIECEDEELCKQYAKEIEESIILGGYKVE